MHDSPIHCRAALLSPVFVVLTAFAARAGDVPAPKPTPDVAVVAPESGAVTVKLTRLPQSSARFVDMTVEGRKLKMLVDTGSDITLIHADVAEQLRLRVDPAGEVVAAGAKLSIATTLVCRYQIGGLSGGFQQVCVADLKNVAGARRDGVMRFDGILGMDFLTPHAARLDLAADTLDIRSPFAAPMARLTGHWACTRGETPDGPIDADRCAAITYDSDRGRARYKTRKMDEQFYFVADTSETPARLLLYHEAPAVLGKRAIAYQCALYKMSGDTLTVLSQYDGAPAWWDAIPKELKPAKNFAVMHFKRTGPAAPFPPAVALPAAAASTPPGPAIKAVTLPPAAAGPGKP